MSRIDLKRPKALHPGSRIGIVAPAGPFDPGRFEKGIEVLERQGYEPVIPDGLATRKGYLAGSDTHRAEIFMRFFTDSSIDAVWCARGGYGAMRILPLLDYAAIGQNPKIFIGFSDITALLLTLYQRCGLVTYHGPVITSLGEGSTSTRAFLAQIITGGKEMAIAPTNGFVVHPGESVGPVIGGNLTLLSHLMGTPFMPDYDGHILFIEDCGEKPYRIDRMLTQMRLSGCLDGIAGLLLGCFTDCGSSSDIAKIVADCFKDRDIPIMGGFDIGHERNNLTLPIGLTARLSTDTGCLSYQEAAVSPFLRC